MGDVNCAVTSFAIDALKLTVGVISYEPAPLLSNESLTITSDSVISFIDNHDCSLFDFYGSIGIPNYIEISATICILYVIGIILSSIIAIILISKKQSKYA